jgi:hypothetical protein
VGGPNDLGGTVTKKYPFVFCSGPKEACYRVQRFVPCSFRTRNPAHKLYDLWTRAPVSQTGLPLS